VKHVATEGDGFVIRYDTHYTAFLSFELEKPDINQSINHSVCLLQTSGVHISRVQNAVQWKGSNRIRGNEDRLYIQYVQEKNSRNILTYAYSTLLSAQPHHRHINSAVP